MKVKVMMVNSDRQDTTPAVFDIFREGVEFLASMKKDGKALEGNSSQAIYVIEEINELITELLKLQKTITKFEKGKFIDIDTIIEETGDVWLTSAILLNMINGSIGDVLQSANDKVVRTIRYELGKDKS